MNHALEIIKFRIFGSSTCDDCTKLIKAMKMYSVEYDFIDANDEKNDAICDRYNIDGLPCLQALRNSDGKMILQRIGYVSPMIFLQDVAAALEELSEPRNLFLKGVRQDNPNKIRPTSKIQNKCNGCKNESKNS